MAAASQAVIWPSSGNSAINIMTETGPISRIDRRSPALAVKVSLSAMTFSILYSISSI
jgi:hypothetical protein